MHMKQTKKKHKFLFVPLSVSSSSSSIRQSWNVHCRLQRSSRNISSTILKVLKDFSELPFKLANFLRKIEIFGDFWEKLNCQNLLQNTRIRKKNDFSVINIKENCKFRRIICSCETPTRKYLHIYVNYC